MNKRILTGERMEAFKKYLSIGEKSPATIEKYSRDIVKFAAFLGKEPVTKERVIDFKAELQRWGYALRSINSMLASVNSLLRFLGWEDCKVCSLRLQRSPYCSEERELQKEEYIRLLRAAEHKPQLKLVMQTICATGIRVSELQYFTVEGVRRGELVIRCKNKTRVILLPGKLRVMLLRYASRRGIRKGVIFRGRGGKPLNRSRIWAQMKGLYAAAGVSAGKVFPHNLRRLFARAFYALDRDIAKLADVLGHSSIETTRIYIMTTGMEHRRKLEQLDLLST